MGSKAKATNSTIEQKAPKVVRLLVQGGGHSEIIKGPADPIELGLMVVHFAERYRLAMNNVSVRAFRELKSIKRSQT